uniref:Transcription repressor MYB5 n=1 Tax=Rhizophora mucronata TaxID=61149 RepID=A0A2P2R2E6_RHIMU
MLQQGGDKEGAMDARGR